MDVRSSTMCEPGARREKGAQGKWRTVWRFFATRLQLPEDVSGLALGVFMLLVSLGGFWAAAFVDPVTAEWFPQCPVHRYTGLDCPGCGTARALHALVRGDWRAAWRYNAILFAAIPFLAAIVVRPRWAKRPAVAWSVFAVLAGWMVLRNFPKWI